VRRGAETVETETLRLAGHPVRAVTDQPGAHQRRGLLIGIALRYRETEADIGDTALGEPAVDLVAGVDRLVTQVLASAAAEFANATATAQPRHSDAVARREPRDPFTQLGDSADDLVTRYQR